MMHLHQAFCLVVMLLLGTVCVAADSGFDLGPGVTDYQRFVAYPHLERAFAAQARNDRETAIKHLERVRELLPQNPASALYLAEAYRQFGEPARAEALLRAQLAITPGDAQLASALAAITPRTATANAPANTKQVPNTHVAPKDAVATTNVAAQARSARGAAGINRDDFSLEIARGEHGSAGAHALARWGQNADVTRLDSDSFRLVDAGADAQAVALLVAAWPWGAADEHMRLTLLNRLAFAAARSPSKTTPDTVAPLANAPAGIPESTAARGARAAVFAAVGDCRTVRSLLGDFAPAYGRDDWLRLGDCLRDEDSPRALLAYRQAFERAPDAVTARSLAYQSFAERDFDAALVAWRGVPPDERTAGDRLAGAATAVAAGVRTEATRWLDEYAAKGGDLDDRYWWLRAQALGRDHPAGAEQALQQAIAIQPRPDYVTALATLQRDRGAAGEATATLEQATAAHPDDVGLQRSLAWTRLAAGDHDGAARDFARVTAEVPADATSQEQLMYLELDAANLEAARARARAVIDLLADDESAAGRVFRLQRLHEDLGRRWTYTADLSTGTRVATVANAPAPGSAFRSFLQLEAQYRVGDDAMRRDNRLTAYGRLIADGGKDAEAVPLYTPVAGIGLRARPFLSQVAYVALEYQEPLDHAGSAQRDLMLRISASFLDQGRYSGEWRPEGRGWVTRQLYVDAARFLDAERDSLYADFAVGYQHKLATAGQSVEPYAHLQYSNQIANGIDSEDVRAGLGLRWHLRYGMTRHDAWPHKATLGLEIQHAFRSYLQESDTLVFSVGIRW